jgi:NADPH:quinone reductase
VTLPSAALAAAYALYVDVQIPSLWMVPASSEKDEATRIPIVIHGITSPAGAVAAKLSRFSGLHPIIGVASNDDAFAASLADDIVDESSGTQSIASQIRARLPRHGLGSKTVYILDAGDQHGPLTASVQLLHEKSDLSKTLLPPRLIARGQEDMKEVEGIQTTGNTVSQANTSQKDFVFSWSRYLGRLLADGRLRGHPHHTIKDNFDTAPLPTKVTGNQKISVKYVLSSEDTPL